MNKHKSEDYKIALIEYQQKYNLSFNEMGRIFGCSVRSLIRWNKRYLSNGNIDRNNREPISYKIKQKHIDYALKLLTENKHYSMEELVKRIKKNYDDFNITPQHLGQVIRDNNITRKRTKLKHFPKTRFGKEINLKDELKRFYEKVDKYDINKIICLDETSIQPYMIPEYCRSKLGTKCVDKTDDNFVFRKFTLLMAISRNGLVGAKIYEKNRMTKERFVDFIDKFIKGKYKHHLIILDNAGL
jgi:transposase